MRLRRMPQYVRITLAHPHPVAFVTSRLLRAARVSQLVTMRFPRFRLRLYPTAISESYWTDRRDRSDDHEFLERHLRPGDTVVDVGANIGALTVHSAALVGPSGRVIAFEAHPRTYRYLRGNIALNHCRNVTAHQIALGAASGETTFSDLKSDDLNAVDVAGTVRVPLATLDSMLVDVERIALLKVDVEGFEREVFRGASETLRKTDCVFFESWDEQFSKYGYGTPEVIALLADAGFTTASVERGSVSPVPAGYRSQRCENLVAVRDLHAFQERWAASVPS